MGIKKLNLKYIDNINNFTDFSDTPNIIEDGKIIKTNSDGSAIEFSGDSNSLNDETVDNEEYSLDYITGFDMESFSPDVDGYHEKIRINKGFVEIAEPGDLSSNDFWNSTSKMVANYPLRNGQTKDISGHKNNGYALSHRRYPFTDLIDVYYKKDGDSLHYHTKFGTASDFLTSPFYYRDEYPILDNSKVAISCWVKYTSSITDFRYIFTDALLNSGAGIEDRIVLFGQNGMNTLRVFAYDGNRNGRKVRCDVSLSSSLQVGQWYHFFLQFDSNDFSNTFEIYVNNNLESFSIHSDDRVNTELPYNGDSFITIGGYFYINGNYIVPAMIKSCVYFNRLLTSTEREYLYNNVYLVRGLNSTPSSDIYELPSDVDIDTENLTVSDFLDDTYTSSLENRWYYLYVVPSSTNGECEIKLSARAPIRNRFGVEMEDYRRETGYHPYLNARCIGTFQYGRIHTLDTAGKKVIKFKMVDGYFQFGETFQYTRPNNVWSAWHNSNRKNLPSNCTDITLSIYYNGYIRLAGGLNQDSNYQRHLQRPDATKRTIFYKIHTYSLFNMGANIYWRQWVSDPNTNRVYLHVYSFYFTQ
ncbi:MAG: LamG-like jellyroll fold domain-containing protein [bacterium]